MLNFPSFFNAKAGGYEIEQSLRFDGGGSKLVLASPTSSYTTNKFRHLRRPECAL